MRERTRVRPGFDFFVQFFDDADGGERPHPLGPFPFVSVAGHILLVREEDPGRVLASYDYREGAWCVEELYRAQLSMTGELWPRFEITSALPPERRIFRIKASEIVTHTYEAHASTPEEAQALVTRSVQGGATHGDMDLVHETESQDSGWQVQEIVDITDEPRPPPNEDEDATSADDEEDFT